MTGNKNGREGKKMVGSFASGGDVQKWPATAARPRENILFRETLGQCCCCRFTLQTQMGAGGDARPPGPLLKRVGSGKAKLDNVKNDLQVLKSIWFNKVSGDDHAERLESFYGPQAAECALSIHHVV